MMRIVLTAIFLLLMPLSSQAAEAAGGPARGSQAPAFSLLDSQGRQVRLDDYKGQVVVLNFWAFWCDTWKAELPH
ncbi:MAG: redoxin domain-containing protein, partial [Armatimonadota bacterium]|nr:redoxin domain-containing protein [Armatimonadota bacterium]